MQTTTSKLTKKYQATIPAPVRKVLQLKAGDTVSFDIKGRNIILRKSTPVDYLFTHTLEDTLTEWATKEDDEAYGDL